MISIINYSIKLNKKQTKCLIEVLITTIVLQNGDFGSFSFDCSNQVFLTSKSNKLIRSYRQSIIQYLMRVVVVTNPL